MRPSGMVRPHEAIAAAIRRKASRYGDLNLPYIVAVNVFETFANYKSVIDALFGTEAVVARRYGHECVRNPDGVWYGRGGPTYSRVSAVLSTERLSAWDIGQRSLRLIHNSWTTRPLPELPLGVHIARIQNDILVTTPGVPLRELFELPEGWPEYRLQAIA